MAGKARSLQGTLMHPSFVLANRTFYSAADYREPSEHLYERASSRWRGMRFHSTKKRDSRWYVNDLLLWNEVLCDELPETAGMPSFFNGDDDDVLSYQYKYIQIDVHQIQHNVKVVHGNPIPYPKSAVFTLKCC